MTHGALYIRKPDRDATLPKILIALLFAGTGAAIRLLSRRMAGFADLYAELMVPFWTGTLGRVSGLVNFSVVEILIYIIIAVTVLHLISIISSIRIGDSDRWRRLVSFITNILILVSLIFMLYEAGEDIYFYRTPFSEAAGFGEGSYTTEDLTAVCRYLADACNSLSEQVERNDEGLMVMSADPEIRVAALMTQLGNKYPMLAGRDEQPKPGFFFWLMSKTDMAGIYSAYTIEANYNRDMADYNKPFTMSHELAHTHGVLREDEANFVAYLNCMSTNQSDIRYAGALSGWIYCGNELFIRDHDAWEDIHGTLNESVIRDLAWNTAFWEKYKGVVSEGAQSFNDSFLKSHGQELGTESYNRVTDLIVSYEKRRGRAADQKNQP